MRTTTYRNTGFGRAVAACRSVAEMTAIDHDATGEPDVTPEKPDRKVSRALGMSLLNTAIGRLGTVITGIVLAHILSPADFGAFAVALVALAALLSITSSVSASRWCAGRAIRGISRRRSPRFRSSAVRCCS